MANYKKLISCIFLLLALAGCSGGVKCIEPDDFGFASFQIQSLPPTSQVHTIQTPPTPEYADWVDTGYITNGESIKLIVRNNYSENGQCETITLSPQYSWTSWYGTLQSSLNSFLYNNVCTNANNETSGCSTTCWCDTTNSTVSGTSVSNPPCVFIQGVGAYAMLYSGDPANVASLAQKGEAPAPVYHLGIGSHCNGANYVSGVASDSNKVDLYDSDCKSGGLYLDSSIVAQSCGNKPCHLYVRMLDTIYEDNFGSYEVKIESGFQISSGGAFTWLVNKVTTILSGAPADPSSNTPAVQGASEMIYTQLVGTLSYVRVLLVLYVAVSAIMFLMGVVEISQKELMIRALKMALVLQVSTTATSWEFFNNYLFKGFTEGIGQVSGMISNSIIQSANASSGQTAFMLFDSLINMIFSKQVATKLASLLFTPGGPIFFVLFYIAGAVAAYAALRATMVYLIGYLVISVLIILGPIFIPFILFQFSSKLFDKWLSGLMTYFLQPLLVLILAIFLCDLIIDKIYYVLGFRVCWTYIFTALGLDFYIWRPQPAGNKYRDILIPGGDCSPTTLGTNGDPDAQSIMCPPGTVGKRNLDAPFLDITDDAAKLSEFANGIFINFADVAVFALLVLLLLRFINLIPAMANVLAGDTYQLTNIFAAGENVTSNIFKASDTVFRKLGNAAEKTLNIGKSLATGNGFRGKIQGVYSAYTEDLGKKYSISARAEKLVKSVKEKIQDKIGSTGAATYVDSYLNKDSKNLFEASGRVMLLAVSPFISSGLYVKKIGYDDWYKNRLTDAERNKSVWETSAKLDQSVGVRVDSVGKMAGKVVAGTVAASVTVPVIFSDMIKKGVAGGITNWLSRVTRLSDLPNQVPTGQVSNMLIKASKKTGGKNVGKYVDYASFAAKAAFSDTDAGRAASAASERYDKFMRAHPTIAEASTPFAMALSAAAAAPQKVLSNAFRTSLVSGALKNAGEAMKYYSADKETRAMMDIDEESRNRFHNYQDKIGGVLDNFIDSHVAAGYNAIYSLTGGAFGEDMNKRLNEEKEDSPTKADLLREQYAINEENWSAQFSDATIGGLGFFGKSYYRTGRAMHAASKNRTADTP